MKLLLFFIFVLYSTPCLGQIPQDKLLHMGGCYAISATTSSIMYNITENKKKSFIYGVSSAVIIGGIKELHDINHGDSNWTDMRANVIGATLGAITVTIRF
jgi:VanZ family protein